MFLFTCSFHDSFLFEYILFLLFVSWPASLQVCFIYVWSEKYSEDRDNELLIKNDQIYQNNDSDGKIMILFFFIFTQ